MFFGNHIDLGTNELQNAVIQNLAADPTGIAGRIYYNTGDNKLKLYDGTQWRFIGENTFLSSVALNGTNDGLIFTMSDTSTLSVDLSALANMNLQEVTDEGNTTTNSIGIGSSITLQTTKEIKTAWSGAAATDGFAYNATNRFTFLTSIGGSLAFGDSEDETPFMIMDDMIILPHYGAGNMTSGAITKYLAVDANGNIVEADLTTDILDDVVIKNPAGGASQTINGDIVINGDFTVSGSTTTTISETVNIEDNLFVLNSNLTSGTAPTEDAGFIINRGLDNASGEATVGLVWDESADKFVFGSYGTADGSESTLTQTTKVNIEANNGEFASITLNTATTAIASPVATDEVLVRDSSTGEVKHVDFSEFGSVNRATGTITGDSATKDWVITHNLGVQLVQVQVYNAASPFNMILTDIELTSTNTATIKFAQNVPTGTDYNVIVIG